MNNTNTLENIKEELLSLLQT